LEFEGTRVFAVLFEYGQKGSAKVIMPERMELNPLFLEKMDPKHGADFLHKKEIELPDPAKN